MSDFEHPIIRQTRNVSEKAIICIEFLAAKACVDSLYKDTSSSYIVDDKTLLNIRSKWVKGSNDIDRYMVIINLLVDNTLLLDGNFYLFKIENESKSHSPKYLSLLSIIGNKERRDKYINMSAYEAHSDIDLETESKIVNFAYEHEDYLLEQMMERVKNNGRQKTIKLPNNR